MTDPFKSHETSLTSPARNGFSITPDDSADLSITCRALFIGGGGDISAILAGDSTTILLKGVPTGTVLPIAVRRIEATLTTATDIVGLY